MARKKQDEVYEAPVETVEKAPVETVEQLKEKYGDPLPLHILNKLAREA